VVDQRGGGEGGGGDAGKDQHVVGGLQAGAVAGRAAFDQVAGGADVEEVPADAEQDQRAFEVGQGVAAEGDGDAGGGGGAAGEHYRRRAPAADQVAGEEGRQEHRDHVPLDHRRAGGEVEAAAQHRQRGRGHQQVHQRVADHRRQHRQAQVAALCEQGE